jgi:hypothetical protein
VNEYSTPPTVTYLDETYKHFQTAKAETRFVLGEFPWQVRVGEFATVADYISPPRVISSEDNGQEITWSMGEYIYGRDLWKAFGLKGDPPQRIGVYENQPSPLSAAATKIWVAFAGFALVLLLMLIGFAVTARNEQVMYGTYQFNTNSRGEASFVTDVFEVNGHTSNLELTTEANVNNNWMYVNYALINRDTGQAYDFGREVSYYSGSDQDGPWTEGSRYDHVTIPSVPPGYYYLRVEPESDTGRGTIDYSISLKRDVPQMSFYGLAFLALLAPAALITWRSMNFEHLRWAEGD